MKLTPEERNTCAELLQNLADDPAQINDDERLKALIAKIHRDGKKGQRRERKNSRRIQDQEAIKSTGIVSRASVNLSLPDLTRAQNCYICKAPFTRLHFFYHALCPDCAAFNYEKRLQRAELRGRVALITGGRIKIGYQLALRLLRDGARVIITTRFPHDAARRFTAEADFADWHDRLVIYSLDLRRLNDVEAFLAHLNKTEASLDILVNNAAQTVKRPLAFYEPLLAGEKAALTPAAQSLIGETNALAKCSTTSELLEALPFYPVLDEYRKEHFPHGELDNDGQQRDLRPLHSWLLRLDEISSIEMLEVQLVNVFAPFLFNSRLKPLMMRSLFARRFIINVSAMEGQFNRANKTAFHPHTNMAKAALNMMTRTSAQDYARQGIYMNSVDTGWITDENPHPKAERMRAEQNFYTPLDVHDGAARIYDPIARGVNETEEPLFGRFLKDYAPHEW